jgi:hypothetical protein
VFDEMAAWDSNLNFGKLLYGCDSIMFGSYWWCWFAKLGGFVKIQNVYDLESDLVLQLYLIILRN